MSVLLAILFTPLVLLLLAFAVGRLLGVPRSVRYNVLATIVGYVAGSVIAYQIADGDITDRSFGWSQLYLAVLAAMAFAVLQELLIPVLPEGRSDPHRVKNGLRDRYRRTRRLREVISIARRTGLLSRQASDESRAPARLREALEEAGGIFVKLGQVLATRPEFVPAPYVIELAKLHSSVGPAPVEAIRAEIERELDAPIEELFERFDDEPLAAGSVGQVHSAQLRNGDEVIVKVQRPGIAESMRADLDVLRRLADVLERRTTWANSLHIGAQIDDFVAGLDSELDFTLEASNLAEFADVLSNDPSVRVPGLHRELCTNRVIVMERFNGPSVQRRDALVAAGHDPEALARKLLATVVGMTVTNGLFHGDPHPGNFIVLADGTIGIIDLGYVGRLDSAMLTGLRDLFVAIGTHNGVLATRAVLDVASPGPDVDSAGLERALTRFIASQFGPVVSSGSRLSAFGDLFRIVGEFGLHVPGEFATLAQSLVKLEGTLLAIAPGLRLDEELGEVTRSVAQPHLGDVPKTLQNELLRLLPLLRDLPQDAERITRQLVNGELITRVRSLADPEDRRFIERLVNRALLVVLTVASAALSLVLITLNIGPTVSNDVTMTDVLGVVGLGSSMILWMRVLIATVRDS